MNQTKKKKTGLLILIIGSAVILSGYAKLYIRK